MELFNIVWPADPVGKVVIVGLLIIFGWWCSEAIRKRLLVVRATFLAEKLGGNRFWEEYKELKADLPESSVLRRLFDKDAHEGEAVIEYFLSCHNASVGARRLDAKSLAQQLTGNYVSGLQRLRSVLSVFIIIGLFGTLWGLAVAVQDLAAPIDAGSGTPVNIDQLIAGLRGAFAPSLWGVLLSIIGVFVISALQHNSHRSFYAALSQATITKINPNLFPEPSAAITSSLKKSFDKAARLASASENLGTAADRIENQVRVLEGSITSANSQSNQYVEYLEVLNVALSGLGSQLARTTEEIGRLDSVGKTIEGATDDLRKVAVAMSDSITAQGQMFSEHEQLISSVSGSIKTNSEISESVRQAIVDLNNDLLEGIEQDEKRRQEERQQFADNVVQPLQDTLKDHLIKVERSVADFSQGVGRVSHPLNNASDKMADIAGQMQKNFSNSMERLQGEFSRQTEVRESLANTISALNNILTKISPTLSKELGEGRRKNRWWRFGRRG